MPSGAQFAGPRQVLRWDGPSPATTTIFGVPPPLMARDATHLRDGGASTAIAGQALLGPAAGVTAMLVMALAVGAAVAGAEARAPLVVAGILVAGACACLLVWPHLAAVAAVFLIYSDAAAVAVRQHGAPSVIALAVPLLLAAPLAAHLLRRERLVINPPFIWLLVLLVVQVASTTASRHPPEATAQLVKFLVEGVVVYFLVVNAVRTPVALRRASWAVVAGGTFLAVTTLFQQFFERYASPHFGFALIDGAYFRHALETYRAQGPLGDSNYYAQILLPVVALSLVHALRGRARPERLVAIICAGTCALAIAFTYSRGAMVALAFVLVGLALFRYVRPIHLAATAGAAALLLMLVPGYGDRVVELGSVRGATATPPPPDPDLAVQGRATEMHAAWLVFLDYPALGVGPDGFPLFYQEYARRAGGYIHTRDRRTGEVPARAAHTFFLGIAAELGIAGVLAFLALIGATVASLLRARRQWLHKRPELEALGTGMLLALGAYLTAGLFLSLAYERYFWLLMALAAAAAHMGSDEARTDRRLPLR